MNAEFIKGIAPIVSGGFAMFCAIMLWPRTTERSWLYVILAVIFGYAGIVIAALDTLGLFRIATGLEWLDMVLMILVGNGSYILLAIGLLIAFRERGRRG